MQYLILGANGYIGSYLYNRMTMEGIDVIGTGHSSKGSENLLSFDLLKDSISDVSRLITDKEKTAIFCIAQSNIDRCKREYELSRQINVLSAKKTIRELMQEQFHLIYFSTDNVFDGIKGNYTEQDKTNAINEYGKMKEEMEHFLMEEYPETCIMRLPKVVKTSADGKNLFSEWVKCTEKGEALCIRDNYLSLVTIEDLYQACMILSNSNMRGLYHVAGDERCSRAEIARKFFDKLGDAKTNIRECDLKEFPFYDKRPLNIGLCNSKFKKETGYQFMSLDEVFNGYVNHIKKV